MMPFGNLLLWIAVLGVVLAVLNLVSTLIGKATDGRIRRKCRKNHGRVVTRRSRRPLVTLSVKTAKG